jgi:hypothetical protein
VAIDEQVARHAQVHRQVHVVLERDDQVLAAAAEALDRASSDRVLERARRRRFTPARIEHLHALEPPTLEHWRQLAANRLDLGELGHASDLRRA